MRKEWTVRWSFFSVGLIVLAFGITLTIKGKALGIAPWDVLHYGLHLNFGLTIGTWSIIIGSLLLLITSIVQKAVPKIGAFLNMLLIGIFIDFFNWILPNINSLIGSVIALTIGIVIIAYGIGLYVSADFGAGPRDGMMLIIVEKTGWSINAVRSSIEFIVFLVGWALGGPVGVGTIMLAFGLGPVLGRSIPQCRKALHFYLKKFGVHKIDSNLSA